MEQQNQPQPPVFNQPQQPMPQYQPRVEASPMLDPVTAVKTCFKKYFDFKGRARRSEYWWFVLFMVIVSMVFNYGGLLVPALSFIGLFCSLVLVIPHFAVMTRRLHDTGRSGWWVLVLAILYVAVLVSMLIVLMPIAQDMLTVTDPFEQMEMMADCVQAHPVASTVMVMGSLVTCILGIIVIIFMVFDSKWETNKYGPSPKYQ
jgi:uncharacterized membrane protein YhaH (DUF805 family)